MSLQVYLNGQFVDEQNAKVSVFDHGFLFGDGIFEGLRSYAGVVFRLKAHVDRLWYSAKSLNFEIPMTKEEMIEAIKETIQRNNIDNGYVRVVVTRGIGTLGLDAHLCEHPQIVIIANRLKLYPPEVYANGLTLVTASTVRNNHNMLSPRVKSLNYLNNIMAKIEGHTAGCVEALMLNQKGEVAECTGDNIFFVKDGKLYTPPVDAGILEGVTRNTVLELARELGIETFEVPFTRHDLYTADESFLTGSAAEVVPVTRLDGRQIGSGKAGPVTLRILDRYRLETQNERY